jgi:hypothetical protein
VASVKVVGPGVVPHSRENKGLRQGAGVKGTLRCKRNFRHLPHRNLPRRVGWSAISYQGASGRPGCRLYPRQPTCSASNSTSAKCQKQTSTAPRKFSGSQRTVWCRTRSTAPKSAEDSYPDAKRSGGGCQPRMLSPPTLVFGFPTSAKDLPRKGLFAGAQLPRIPIASLVHRST